MLRSLLARGYFPRELPPVFSTMSFGMVVAQAGSNLPSQFRSHGTTHSIRHGAIRSGFLRRPLMIPNPISYFSLCDVIVNNWTDIQTFIAGSRFSRSSPVRSGRGRAIIPRLSQNQLVNEIVALRAGPRVMLKTDIARFYGSIYTHSIPWALHTKPVAKSQRRNYSLLGNSLDQRLRSCQDGQTVGIAIGPDASLVIAEVILAAVDRSLVASLAGLRYVDDYELLFDARSGAEEGLARLQEALGEYELELNGKKTQIVDLPVPHEKQWVRDLRAFEIRAGSRQVQDLLGLFDHAFASSRAHPEEPVLRYLIGFTNRLQIEEQAWPIFQSLLFQTMIAEPGVLFHVLGRILDSERMGYRADLDRLEAILNQLIMRLIPLGQFNEVAWALWGLILFELSPTSEVLCDVGLVDNPFVALLALYAINEIGGVWHAVSGQLWASYMTADELLGEQWILAYEAMARGWLPPSNTNPFTSHPAFQFLNQGGVRFFNERMCNRAIVRATRRAPSRGIAPIFSTV